jgi:hypothetical protein
LYESGVDPEARQVHEVLHIEFGSLLGQISSVLGIEAENDLVAGVSVDTGTQTWGQLFPVLMGNRKSDTQTPGLTESVFEIRGER